MKKIFAMAMFCGVAVFSQAQDRAVKADKATEERSEATSGNVLELRYIKVPTEHRENAIMVDGKRYELWHSKERAEYIYKKEYLGKNLGTTIIYVRSDAEKEPETIRYDN